MMEGFSLQASLHFLQKLYHHHARYSTVLIAMYTALSEGAPLYQVFSQGHFSQMTISQIKLSQLHGDLDKTLGHIANHLKTEQNKTQQLYHLLAYPMILLIVVISLILAMKYYLFPQVDAYLNTKDNMGYWFVNHFGLLLGGLLLLIAILYIGLRCYQQHQEALVRYQFYLHIPFLRWWCKTYCTYYFCYEWGRLLQLGIETRAILMELQSDGHPPWLQELSQQLEEGMRQGRPLSQQIKGYPFFEEGLFTFIEEGEAKSQLGDELLFYAETLWKRWLEQLERWLSWVQPIIFIFVGVLIISLYASILLPMYQSF